jgi:hypothetical protein
MGAAPFLKGEGWHHPVLGPAGRLLASFRAMWSAEHLL